MSQETENQSSIAGTVVTATQILDVIAERGRVYPQDLSRELNLNRSTVHRMLHTLQILNCVGRQSDGTFRLTFHLFELGNSVPHSHNLIDGVRPHLLQLSQDTGFTVNHAILYEDQVLYIDKAAPPSYLQMDRAVGESEPLHCTSLGKVLVAYQDPSEADAIINRIDYSAQTEYTITDREIFRREISRVRNQGYALDDRELALEVRCVSVPLIRPASSTLSAISVSGPVDRLLRDMVPDIVGRLRDVVAQIEASL